jgi:hypothetical protein
MFPKGVEHKAMQTSTQAAHVLRGARPDQQVEVVFEITEGEERVALRYSTWTEGLGWCCQKTIRLETDQLDELHRALTVARHRRNRRRAEAGEPHTPAQVIHRPALK